MVFSRLKTLREIYFAFSMNSVLKLTSLHTRYLRLEVLLFELKSKLLLKNLIFNFKFVANDKTCYHTLARKIQHLFFSLFIFPSYFTRLKAHKICENINNSKNKCRIFLASCDNMYLPYLRFYVKIV